MSESLTLPGLKQMTFAIERVTKPFYAKYGVVQSRLLMDWEKIVGKTLARSSRPMRLVFREGCRVDGLLYVEIYHSSLATQMMFMEPVVLEKIATYFGYKAVARLKIIQKPSMLPITPEKQTQPNIIQKRTVDPQLLVQAGEIEDESLRASLERLINVL